MKKKLIIFQIVLLALYLGAGWYFSSLIIKFEHRTLEQDKEHYKNKTYTDYKLPEPQTFEFENESQKFKGWYFPNPQKKSCAVLMLHGVSSTRYGVLKYSPLVWEKGCSLFFYDQRMHGESTGNVCTYGYYEKRDAKKAIEEIQKITNLKTEQIGIYGESFGAAVAIQAAAEYDLKLKFLIGDSPYKDLVSILEKRAVDLYGKGLLVLVPTAILISEVRGEYRAKEVSPVTSAKKVNVPLLLIHSKADEFTPYTHSEEIFEASPSPKKEVAITLFGAKHAQSIDVDPAEYKKIFDAFWKKSGL